MRKWMFPIAVLMVTLLVVSSSAISPAAATAVWKDINPTAYLNPPENPDLGAVVMFPGSPREGWAVGTAQPPTNATTSLPGIFHYDGEFWNLVPAPRFPDFPSTQCPYNLKGLSFGPPNNPISKNDGWAVGQAVRFPQEDGIAQSANQNCINNATAIHWDGVSWKVQMSGLSGPDAGELASVFMVSPTDVWAVGENNTLVGCPVCHGTIWHWTGVPGLGGGWNLVATVPDVLNSVFMVSSTEGWAVGRNPSTGGRGIYHYFAGGWTAVPSPFPPCAVGICELASVFMISATEGWAVGTNGVILHYSQGIWSGPVSPGTTTQELFSVFMVSSGEGWAVGGGSITQTVATILHYTGGIWSALPINLIPVSPTVDFSLASVFFTTATDGWAVGTAGLIVHFDGVNWGSVTSPSINNFTSVNFGPPLTGPVNPNDGWAVGNVSLRDGEPTIFHWNGFFWTKGTAIGTMNNLNSVFMLSTADAWTVGGGTNATASCASSHMSPSLCPVILHFTGGAWNTVTPPPGVYTLKSVFMVNPTEGWAVGEQAGSTSILLHYTVTGGVGTWGIFPGPPAIGGLDSVFMLGPYEGWAVGDNKTILHYTVTGGVGTWNIVPVSGSPTLSSDANLTSVFMLSPTSGWIVGGIQANDSFSAGPVILYWDGLKWSQVATPSIPGGISSIGHTSATLKSVFCSGPNDCWAAGLPGILLATLFHWDGVAWTHVTTTPALIGEVPPILTSIYLTSPDAGWIVGSDPEFPSPLTQSFAFPGTMVEALSTMLRASPTVVSTTSTSTVFSTVTTLTTFLTGVTTYTTQLTSASSTSTTIAPPPGSSGFLVPVILAVVVALAVGLVAILLLLGRRRRPRPPVVLYPIPRRP
jgi:photosystem II stability/assembly factor-like uncharacterized protein